MTDQQRTDPARDAAVRMRAHHVMTGVYYEMKNVLMRYYDEDGMYIEPPGVGDGGDNTGMMLAANNEVLRRLDHSVKAAREKLSGIFDEIDDYKRERIGPNYNPGPHNLNL